MPEERVQKILARAGFGSRRSSEDLISAGRVSVNGKVITLGSKADAAKDKITVDGHPIRIDETPIYIALYKPRGILSDVQHDDPRQNVNDLVPITDHLFSVGRLDLDSEGLILLTNDGELANQLTHPRFAHEKVYKVLVATRPDSEQLEIWRRGVVLEDGYRTKPAEVYIEGPFGKGTWLRVVLSEGRKRQIREIGSKIGLPVVRIIRIRIGSLELGGLKPRDWRYLTPQEVAALKGQKTATTHSKQPIARPPRQVTVQKRPSRGGNNRAQRPPEKRERR